LEERRQQDLRLLEFRDYDSALEENRRSQDQNRAIYEERAIQRHDGINQVVPARGPLFQLRMTNAAAFARAQSAGYILCGITVAPRIPMAT